MARIYTLLGTERGEGKVRSAIRQLQKLANGDIPFSVNVVTGDYDLIITTDQVSSFERMKALMFNVLPKVTEIEKTITFVAFEEWHRPRPVEGEFRFLVLLNVRTGKIVEIAKRIAKFPYVNEIYCCSGQIDILCDVRITEPHQLEELVVDQILELDGVTNSNSILVFEGL